jgi:hypothetical protein
MRMLNTNQLVRLFCAVFSFAVALLLFASLARAADVYELSFTAHCRYNTNRLSEKVITSRDLVVLANGYATNFPVGNQPPLSLIPVPESLVLAVTTDCSENFSIVLFDKSSNQVGLDLCDVSLISTNAKTVNYIFNPQLVGLDSIVDIPFSTCDSCGSFASINGGILADVQIRSLDDCRISASGTGWMDVYITGLPDVIQLSMTRVTFVKGRKIGTY